MEKFTLRSYINLANADSAAKLPAPRFLHLSFENCSEHRLYSQNA